MQKLVWIFFYRKIFIFFADVPASAAYYGSYEIIQRAMVPEGGDRSQLGLGRTILAGGTAGIFNWIVALPVDVLKSRLQSGTDYYYYTRLQIAILVSIWLFS